MKKRRIWLFILLTLILMIAGYSQTKDHSNMVSLENAAQTYTLEIAKEDGCLVMENGDVTCGQEIYDQFMSKIQQREDASLRVVNYYELGDPSHYAKEYYEEVKDEYPMLFVTDITYNGNKYSVTSYNDGKINTEEYQYIIEDNFNGSASATYTDGFACFLCNQEDVTYHEAMLSYASSQINLGIPHYVIYLSHNYKEHTV